mmetsp:Transcript_16407/g.57359  ORF Transcript_16407/g.57359 Transcript_16407/m.57359 type:complete len:198 (-) Transcript_16407:487-1080(-)
MTESQVTFRPHEECFHCNRDAGFSFRCSGCWFPGRYLVCTDCRTRACAFCAAIPVEDDVKIYSDCSSDGSESHDSVSSEWLEVEYSALYQESMELEAVKKYQCVASHCSACVFSVELHKQPGYSELYQEPMELEAIKAADRCSVQGISSLPSSCCLSSTSCGVVQGISSSSHLASPQLCYSISSSGGYSECYSGSNN